jgi:hypothetical protein
MPPEGRRPYLHPHGHATSDPSSGVTGPLQFGQINMMHSSTANPDTEEKAARGVCRVVSRPAPTGEGF